MKLNLGSGYRKIPGWVNIDRDAQAKPALDIIFRSHASGNFRKGMRRVTDNLGGKEELTIRSLRSLINGLLVLERRNDVKLRLTIIDDHSCDTAVARMRALLARSPFETSFVPLADSGNAASFKACLEYARKEHGELVYFVEDDYLHESSAMVEMYDSYRIFTRHLLEPVALFPVDYVDFYLPEYMHPTRVVLGSQRHWRISYSTTVTFFLPRTLFETHYDHFMRATEKEAQMDEEKSFNPVWREHSVLFSPLPTLAIHVHNENLMPPFSNWIKLWNNLKT